ncbi:MAG: prepilin-type N-terminal cleavage/methylation domain-containing protein, partial [Planctomycetes bacterium]|nr:prepilin-type N-terminal cleavage/methylation domain-containing protein [Planctomycetota bacterium]
MRRRMNQRRKGFTLMEILLVAGILAVLAAFAIPNLIGSANSAKVNLAKASILKNGLL